MSWDKLCDHMCYLPTKMIMLLFSITYPCFQCGLYDLTVFLCVIFFVDFLHTGFLLNKTFLCSYVPSRIIQSLFPQEPNFRGRRVVTFHNQRDYIFFRHHRYALDSLNFAKNKPVGNLFFSFL